MRISRRFLLWLFVLASMMGGGFSPPTPHRIAALAATASATYYVRPDGGYRMGYGAPEADSCAASCS